MKRRRAGKRSRVRPGLVQDQQWAALPERAVCPCPQKIAYPGRKEAKAALHQVRHKTDRGRVHVYRCPCGRFHLGTARLKPGPAPELT